MKRTIYLLLVCAALTIGSCTKTQKQNAQGEALLVILNAEYRSLVVCKDDVMSTYSGPGISDLLQLLKESPESLQGATVADKVVGRAAASLLIAGGVAEVHTNIVSTPALEMLKNAGIKVYAKEEVPMILNRTQTGQCPMEAAISDADDVEQCVRILEERF